MRLYIHVGTFLSGEDPFSPKRIKFPAGGERTACSTLKEQSSEILIWFLTYMDKSRPQYEPLLI